MLAYFDSSAFVKLLLAEDGSDLAIEVWNRADTVCSSRLALPEVHAALAAAGRAHRVSADAARRAVLAWDALWRQIEVVELDAGIAAHAGDLAARFSLSGADAVHLASTIRFNGADLVLITWDRRLAEGARGEGIAVTD